MSDDPTPPSPSLQAQITAHHTSRAALIAHEKSLRHDHPFRTTLTPTARRACAIVRTIRAWEADNIWVSEANKPQSCAPSPSPTSPPSPEDATEIFPGMVFTLAKARMEKTQLWRIVTRLPKGALLHGHLEAMVDVDWLLGVAMGTEGMCIYSNSGPLLTERDLRVADVRFTFRPLSDPVHQTGGEGGGIYDPDYVAGGLVPITRAAESFPFAFTPPHGSLPLPPTPPGCPNTAAFLAWLQSRTTITPHESLLHHAGVASIWRKFQSIFPILSGLVYYEPIYRLFIRHLLAALAADGVAWVEVRMAFHMAAQAAGTGAPLGLSDVVRIYGEEVAAYKAANSGFWGSRIIWTAIRILGADVIRGNMEACIAAKRAYPGVVAGFDLVGYEDPGRSLLSHLPELLWFRAECARQGVEIPFFFHAGETLGDGTAADENLYDAILLGTKRIGHGFALYKHPHLMALVKARGVCVEVCPISNEILRLTASVLGHPLPALLAQGVPVALSNDDPGVLGQKTTGSATHDMWQVLQAFGNVGLEGLGDLCRTSVECACWEGGEGEMARRRGEWEGRWEAFCAWVVEEFGGEWEGRGEGEGGV